MFRLFFWWLLHEFTLLQRIIKPKNQSVLYFAFGANVSAEILAERYVFATKIEPWILEDWTLRFDHPCMFKGVGFASIHPDKGGRVYGHLIYTDLNSMKRLDCQELVPFFRRYKRVTVGTHKNSTIHAYVSNIPRQGLKPSPEYVAKIMSGIGSLTEVSEQYKDYIASQETMNMHRHCPETRYFSGIPFYERALVWLLLNKVRKFSILGRFVRP